MPTPYEIQLANHQLKERQRAEREAQRQYEKENQQMDWHSILMALETQRAQQEALAANTGKFWTGFEMNDQLRDRVLDDVAKTGKSMVDDANRSYDVARNNARTDTFRRGMGGSPTILASIDNRNTSERNRTLNRIEDTLLQNRAAADERLTGNLTGMLERRDDVYPNLDRMQTLQQQLGRFGSVGGIGGGGMGGSVPPGSTFSAPTRPGMPMNPSTNPPLSSLSGPIAQQFLQQFGPGAQQGYGSGADGLTAALRAMMGGNPYAGGMFGPRRAGSRAESFSPIPMPPTPGPQMQQRLQQQPPTMSRDQAARQLYFNEHSSAGDQTRVNNMAQLVTGTTGMSSVQPMMGSQQTYSSYDNGGYGGGYSPYGGYNNYGGDPYAQPTVRRPESRFYRYRDQPVVVPPTRRPNPYANYA